MQEQILSPLTIELLKYIAIIAAIILALRFFFPIIFRLSMSQVLYQASQLAKNNSEMFLSNMLSSEASGKERILEEFKKFKRIQNVKYGKNKNISSITPSQSSGKFTFSAETTVEYEDGSVHIYNINFKTSQGKNQIHSINQIS